VLIPQGPCRVCGHSPLQHIWNRGCLRCRCTNYDVYSQEMTAAEWKRAAVRRGPRKHVDTWLRQQPHLFDKNEVRIRDSEVPR